MTEFVIDPNETWEYVRPCDRDEAGKAKSGCPIFVFGHLTRIVRKHIENNTVEYHTNANGPNAKATGVVKLGDRYELATKYGLKDVVIDGQRAPWFKLKRHAAYSTDMVEDTTLDVLRNLINELGAEAWEKAHVTKEQEENFEQPAV
ncbi:MAG: hypothetical protein A3K04_08175 [Gallionellales bacterium RBG_16_56_9]|nr:MAG: hypothetical protein A3K04_08175 [Gallionellales bacterium RBG_16_56_9]